MRRGTLILAVFIGVLLLSGAAPSKEINTGLAIDPEIITERGNDNGGLTTYGLTVDLFSQKSQEDAKAVAALKQAARDNESPRLSWTVLAFIFQPPFVPLSASHLL